MSNNWRLATSLAVLLGQVNKKWPQRSKSSDGTIGDAAHRSRPSDHNPDEDGVVKALDVTHDPLNGVDSHQLALGLVAARDRRIAYIIDNRKICSGEGQRNPAWVWRPYSGSNPHNKHVHISVRKSLRDDTTPWDLSHVGGPQGDPATFKPPPQTLRLGARNNSVMELQTLLQMDARQRDGIFGPKTKAAVQQFQEAHGLVDDGIVGPATWAALKKET